MFLLLSLQVTYSHQERQSLKVEYSTLCHDHERLAIIITFTWSWRSLCSLNIPTMTVAPISIAKNREVSNFEHLSRPRVNLLARAGVSCWCQVREEVSDTITHVPIIQLQKALICLSCLESQSSTTVDSTGITTQIDMSEPGDVYWRKVLK